MTKRRLRPADLCGQLLAALQASEGRRRRRKRDTTPDAIGLEIKRRLLEGAVAADPPSGEFEAWLMRQCEAQPASGPVRAMAESILAEWHLALASQGFRSWLAEGARSDDRGAG